MDAMFFGWFAGSVIVGAYAASKGRSGLGWALLSLLVSPILAGLFALLVRDRSIPSAAAVQHRLLQADGSTLTMTGTRPCPWCAEPIQPAARICRWCQREVTPLGERELTAAESEGHALGRAMRDLLGRR